MSIKEQQWQREENLFIYLFYFFFFIIFPGIRVATQIQSFHWGMKTRFQGQGQALPSIYAADLLLRRHPSAQVARLSPLKLPPDATSPPADTSSGALAQLCHLRHLHREGKGSHGSIQRGLGQGEVNSRLFSLHRRHWARMWLQSSGAWKSGGDGCAFFSRQKHSLSLTTAFLSKFVSVYHEQR